MASRFVGRDYATLRSEIIDFLRQRMSVEWDYTNLSDPVVILAESLARVGDQLHFTIDELRRECDMATANRASSIYSYAMREGYKMMLPRGSSGIISVNSTEEYSDKMRLTINRFDEIKIGNTSVYSENDIDAIIHAAPNEEYINSIRERTGDDGISGIRDYASYSQDILSRTIQLNVVLGARKSFNFTYNDINSDSTVTLPDPIIDRNLIKLEVITSSYNNESGNEGKEWQYVEDIIASGFVGNIYTLTPKFIGGAITLNIEFPTNYRDLFGSDARFIFTYIRIQNSTIDIDKNTEVKLESYIEPVSGYTEDDIDGSTYNEESDAGGVVIDLNSGIKGYSEYENPVATRENYKNFVQDYSALLTKDDYSNYVRIASNAFCKVFDHSDMYKDGVLPDSAKLIPRITYILTDAKYHERERLWYDLIERSSRSDVIMLMPYGKDPYSIIVKADCFLMGTSVSTISTQIRSEILEYYSGDLGEKIPEISVIDYLTHKASDKVIRMESLIVRDTTFGEVYEDGSNNTDFDDVNTLSNDDITKLFDDIKYANLDDVINGKEDRLKGSIEIEGQSSQSYNKYPVVTYKRFPDSFPEIYRVKGILDNGKVDEEKLTDYNSIVTYQSAYGYCDTSMWDYKDSEIFDRSETVAIEGVPTIELKEDYTKHHYMVPCLYRVIVLIKSIGN